MAKYVRAILAGSLMAVACWIGGRDAEAAVVSSWNSSFVLTSIASSADPSLESFNGGFVARVRNPNAVSILVDLDWVGNTPGDRSGLSTLPNSVDNFFGWTPAQKATFCTSSSCTLILKLAEDVFDGSGNLLAAKGIQLGTKAINTFSYTAPVPLPAAAWLFGSAVVGLGALARRRRSEKTTVA